MPASETPVSELTWNEAFTELNDITSRLTADGVDVDALDALVARAMLLAEHCNAKIDGARARIKVLTAESPT